MDFSDLVYAHAAKIIKLKDHLQTEEATKTALIMPFIQLLGYDVFNPLEVVPEFISDVGTKKGEKVDYAILMDGKPAILIECKPCGGKLMDTHTSQLYRYFSVTEARIAILTDGIRYRFYTDLEASNKMDSRPFMDFDFASIEEVLIPELKKLSKSTFDLDTTLTAASELKYTREIKKILNTELTAPTEEFVRLFAAQVYPGKFTQKIKAQFTETVKKALHSFINDKITERLKSAMNEEVATPDQPVEPTVQASEAEDKIKTTAEELEAYYIVKSILRETCEASRITYRDAQTYFSIFLDDNNRKPICRLWFNGQKKQLGLIGDGKKEEKIQIESLDDIYQYDDQLRAAVALYS